jgi:type IV secretion system T-DNA border endonuclease VirD1
MDYNSQQYLPGVAARPPETQEEPENYKVMSVRMRMAEYEEFSEQASELGLTNSMALRIAARRIAGFLEIDAETRHSLEQITRSIGIISRNIGNLNIPAKADEADLKAFSAQRAAFGLEFEKLDSLLRSILNVSRRRLDGVRKLEQASKQ